MSWDAMLKERFTPEPKSGLTREQKPVRAAFLGILAPEFADALIAECAVLVERDGKRFVQVELEHEIVESRIAEPGELAVEAAK
jgi:hypothetical protein